MKIKKIILYFIIVFSLLIGCVLIAPQLFKKQIENAVKNATTEFVTTPVNFTDLNVSFFTNFPNLSVSLTDLSIKAPKEFGDLKTVESNSVDLGIDLFSLFSDQIKFTKLYVNEGKFNVVTDSLGNFSFAIFKSSDEPSTNSSFSLALNKIYIKNTDVLYQDNQSKIKIETKNTNINGNVQVTDKYINFETNADINSLFFGIDKSILVDHKPLKGSINTKVNLEPISVEFKESNLLLANFPLNILGNVVVLEKGIDFNLNVKSNNASLENLFSLVPQEYQKWYDGMTFKGTSNIHLLLKGLMQDSISNPDLNIKLDIANGSIAAKQFQNIPVENLHTKTELNLPQLNPDSLTVNIPEFAFNLGKGSVKGKALYKFPMFVDTGLNADLNVTQLWQTLAISGMQLKGDVVLNGTAKGNYTTRSRKNTQGTEITEIVEIPTFNVQANWTNGYFKWAEMPLSIDNFSFDLNAENTNGNYKTTKADIKNIDIKTTNDYVKGRLKIDNLIDFNTDTDLQVFVNLANIKEIFPIKEVDFGGQLTINTKAKGRLDLDRNKIPVTTSIIKLKNGYLRYNSLPDLPLENIDLETHISSPRGSLNDLHINVLPISFVLVNEPFKVDANLFNFNNLSFNIGTKGKLNLGNLYKVFAIEGLSVSGQLETDVKLKGKGGADDASSINNRGFVLLKDIHIKSEFFPHDFVFTEGKFKFYKKKMVLENVKMNYAKQQFILNGGLENYINYFLTPNATLKGNLNVTSKFIDVNSFMFGSSSSENTSSLASNSATSVLLIPDKIVFDLTANAQKVKFNDLILDHLSGVLKIYDQKLALHEAKFGLIDAEFNVNATYQPVSTKRALFGFDIDAQNFDIQKAYNQLTLFREMAPAAEKASGQVSLKYQLQGTLNQEMYPDMKTIKGAGDLILENIQFQGFKLFNSVAKETKTDALHDANVKNVVVKTSIENNVMTIERTKFKIAGFRPRVEGQVTLDGKMNIGMRLGLPPFGIIGIPITVKGTSDHFDIKLGTYTNEDLDETDEDYEAYKISIDTTAVVNP
ncbi:AsmA protein [Paenimyroides aquimaris]|uniref:AsmA protein n=1 Tax=Paenimyroides marinum TaxID=1159016 RepID=A0A1H6KMR8_9FLAO|nr:AsmA-like C-terminal region-containing protein [Paenimyroides aquimaris]SEH75042.1 AsmA protein [Paenimyroides aquimaris]